MNKELSDTNSTEDISSAPPYATIIDILPSVPTRYTERNIKQNEELQIDKNKNKEQNSQSSNLINNIIINPVSCIKISCKAVLSSIFITLFIYESDDMTRKDLLYYILLSIIAISNK